jgi:hypothetical protein
VLREALCKLEGKEHISRRTYSSYICIRTYISCHHKERDETPAYIFFFTNGSCPQRVYGLKLILFLKEQIKDMIISIQISVPNKLSLTVNVPVPV